MHVQAVSSSNVNTAGTSDDPDTQSLETMIEQMQLMGQILDQMQSSAQDNPQSSNGSPSVSDAK